MNTNSEIRDLTKTEILDLLYEVKQRFQKSFIRTGILSTSVYFYNIKNSVNTYVNLENKLLEEYQINLHEVLAGSETGS